MRSLVFRFESITAFSTTLDDAHGSLPLPDGETVIDGEWVTAIFEIGSKRRATAAAGRAVLAAGDPHISFERRDWERLVGFVAAKSEHMRAARPIAAPPSTSSGRIPTAPPTDRESAPPPSALESTRVPFTARVLLVDDDIKTRDEISAMLTEVGLVVEAASMAEASARVRTAGYDVVVLDHQQSDPSRILDLVRELRREPRHAPLPVLLLSERPSARDEVDAFASGVDDFMSKPFRAPELGARIFGLLRRARLTRTSTPGSFGGGQR